MRVILRLFVLLALLIPVKLLWNASYRLYQITWRAVGLTEIMNALSTLFPEGEQFFVDSVRHYKDQITDPVLQAEIVGFVGQEAMHSKEHEAFNAMLGAMGLVALRRRQA